MQLTQQEMIQFQKETAKVDVAAKKAAQSNEIHILQLDINDLDHDILRDTQTNTTATEIGGITTVNVTNKDICSILYNLVPDTVRKLQYSHSEQNTPSN